MDETQFVKWIRDSPINDSIKVIYPFNMIKLNNICENECNDIAKYLLTNLLKFKGYTIYLEEQWTEIDKEIIDEHIQLHYNSQNEYYPSIVYLKNTNLSICYFTYSNFGNSEHKYFLCNYFVHELRGKECKGFWVWSEDIEQKFIDYIIKQSTLFNKCIVYVNDNKKLFEKIVNTLCKDIKKYID